MPDASADFPAEDFRATAGAFSAVAGVLGGFSFTVLMLVLPPEFLKEHPAAKEWTVGLLLMGAFLYVASASFLANSMNALVLKSIEVRTATFNLGILLFHGGNIVLAVSLLIVVYHFSSTAGIIATVSIIAIVGLVALVNLGLAVGAKGVRQSTRSR